MLIIRISRGTLKMITAVCAFIAVVSIALAAKPLLKPVAATAQKPVYAVETDEKKVALSFDASWGAEHTRELLAVLAENKVHTTFFLVNLWIEEYPDLVKTIATEGHEIGLHSATHPYFTKLSDSEISKEIEANRKAIEKLTKTKPTVFRPPYGDYDDRVIAAVNRMGFIPVQWSIDSLDWQGLSAAEINDRILPNIRSGDIVLLHNNGAHTAEAIKTLIPAIKAKGYQIVPVGKLLLQGDYFIDENGMMHSGND